MFHAQFNIGGYFVHAVNNGVLVSKLDLSKTVRQTDLPTKRTIAASALTDRSNAQLANDKNILIPRYRLN